MITKYILELLKENTRVIIPDLGAFMTKLKAGAPKDSTDINDKDVSFNDFLKYNDGLLVNHIIKEEKVNKEEALKKIKEFVTETDKLIRKGEKVAIEDIGVLFLGDRGSVKFEEAGSTGAKPVEDKKQEIPKAPEKKVEEPKKEEKKVEVKKEEPKKEEPKKEELKSEKTQEKVESKKVETGEVSKNVMKSLQKKEEEKKSDAAKEEPKKEEKKVEIKKEEPGKETIKAPVTKEPVKKDTAQPYVVPKDNTNQIVLWTSIAVVAVIAIVLVILNFSKIKSWLVPEKSVVVEKVEKPPIEKAKPIVDTVKKEPVKKTPPPAPQKPKEYHVIAGSFKIETNATNFVEKLKSDGYPSEMVGVRNGFHFVCFSSHETRADAVKAMKSIHANGKEAWILQMKKQ